MNHQVMDEYPAEPDEKVLKVLKREGRANPKLIRQETDLDKGTINTVLGRAAQHGDVRKVTRGLYDYIGEDTGGHVNVAAVVKALDDLEAAMERGDRQAAAQALQRARGELNDA